MAEGDEKNAIIQKLYWIIMYICERAQGAEKLSSFQYH